MISRYGVFCQVYECGSFSAAAQKIGYTQSAVSQVIKSLEEELGTVLFNRQRSSFGLTEDGKIYLPYFLTIYNAELALAEKHKEMKQLENRLIRIGTWTSVSRTLLPDILEQFKRVYPGVRFELRQGDYTSVEKWILDGSIELGFVNSDITPHLPHADMYREEMLAILPPDHPLAQKDILDLSDLAQVPMILLDEGDYSVPLEAFRREGLNPMIEYKVYDDYSIMEMVRRGLAVSMVFERVTRGMESGLAIRRIRQKPSHMVALAWQNDQTVSYAVQLLTQFILARVTP